MRPLLLVLLCSLAASAQEAVGLPDAEVMRIHVLEKRPFTESGRWELSFFGATQVNPKFTVHAGFSAELAYHLRENLAVQLGASYFPLAVQSTLSEELLTKAEEAPESAEAFLLQGDVVAGLELMPIYGKLNVFDGKILRLGMYFNAGLGVAKTRLQLRPSTDPTTGRTFGDTGVRPMASLGVGLRVFVTEQFTVRLELRDLAYSGYVSQVNGCNLADVQKIEAAEAQNMTATGLSDGCDERAFGSPGTMAKLNASGAKDLLAKPSAEVINNIAFQGGISWLF
jgi:outer membrane beta-barrel protein